MKYISLRIISVGDKKQLHFIIIKGNVSELIYRKRERGERKCVVFEKRKETD